MKRGLLYLLLALAAVPPGWAHDIWLQADDFTPDRGATLVLRQLLGDELGSAAPQGAGPRELPILWDMTPRFSLLTPEGAIDLLAATGGSASGGPVLERRLDFDGPALAAMEHGVLYTELTNEQFLDHLEHEGLEASGYRERMGLEPNQTEGYQRTLKSLVWVGEASAGAAGDLHRRRLGQVVEILLLQNPYLLALGDELEIQVLLYGEPLAGQLVHALHRDGEQPVRRHRERTNGDGVARFRLAGSGRWLVRLVHLAPCSGRAGVDCADARWESFWSAYSFAVEPRGPAVVPRGAAAQ